MIKIDEDEIQVRHQHENGGSITSLKKCPHGVNVWNDGWDLSLCPKCNQPERLNPEDAKSVCDSPNSENK